MPFFIIQNDGLADVHYDKQPDKAYPYFKIAFCGGRDKNYLEIWKF